MYDEELKLQTNCSKVTASRVEHTYKLMRFGNGIIVAEGSSVLACVNGDGKIRRVPEFMYPSEGETEHK
jgi:acyl-CoA thioesterase FadM